MTQCNMSCVVVHLRLYLQNIKTRWFMSWYIKQKVCFLFHYILKLFRETKNGGNVKKKVLKTQNVSIVFSCQTEQTEMIFGGLKESKWFFLLINVVLMRRSSKPHQNSKCNHQTFISKKHWISFTEIIMATMFKLTVGGDSRHIFKH